jgi:hypothetical protein
MKKFVILLLSLIPTAAFGQGSDASSSSSSAGPASESSEVAPQTTPMSSPSYDTSHHEAPVASVAMHYNYQFQTSPYGGNRSLMGWSVVPEVRLMHHISLQADFTSLYMQGIAVGEKRLLIAAGPRYTLTPRSRFTPFVYGEAGEMRTTTKANDVSDWNPVVRVGIGADFKGKHGVGFQFIPAEYIGEKVEWRNQWNNSFSARAGIVFNLYK